VIRQFLLMIAAVNLAVVASVAPAQEAPAEESAAPQVAYSLVQLMQLALKMRPALRVEHFNSQAADASVRRQQARLWPRLQTAWHARTVQSLARPITLPGGVIRSSSELTTNREASVALDLTFWDNSITPAVEQARAAQDAARYRLHNTERTLLENVAALYFAALGQQQLRDVAQAAVEAARRHLELVDARIEAGTAARSDRLPVEVELARARVQAVQAEKALQQTLASLRATVGLSELTTVEPLGRLEVPPVEGSLDEFIQEAIATRDDVLQQKASVRSRELAVRLARINAGLSLTASGHAEYGRYSGVTGDSWWVQAGINFPLFSGDSKAQLDAAQAELSATRAQLDEKKLQVRQEVVDAFLGVTESEAQIQQAALAEQSAQVNLNAAEERYREGVADIIEVTDANLSLRQAQADHVQALYDYNSARVRLLSAVGRNLLDALGESR